MASRPDNGLRQLNLQQRPDFEAGLHQPVTRSSRLDCHAEDSLVEGNVSSANFTVTFQEEVEVSALIVYHSQIRGVREGHRSSAVASFASVGMSAASAASRTSATSNVHFASVSTPLTDGTRFDLDEPASGRSFSFVLEGFESLPSHTTVHVKLIACAPSSE